MEAGVKITASNCGHFNNALHARFHDEMHTIVTDGTVELSTIFITEELMDEWQEYILIEKELSRESTAAEETESLDDAEVERDGFITYTFETIRAKESSPFPEESEPAKVLIKVVNMYNGLQKESVEEETLHIEGMLADLKKPENAEAVTALGLDRAVEGIETSNEKYKALRLARSNREALEKLPPAKEIRRLSDGIFERVCLLTEAGYVITTDPAVKAAVDALVKKLNKRIAEFKTTYNQLMAQNHGAGSGGGSGTYPGEFPEDGDGGDNDGDGTDEPTPNPDEGGGTPDEGGETPDEGGGTPDEGGETPTPPPGDDDDEEVVG